MSTTKNQGRTVSKASEKNFALILSPSAIELTAKNIHSIINATPNNELHEKYTQMAGLFKMVDGVVKEVFRKRIAKLKDKFIETGLGKISYHERANYSFDEEKILGFIKKNKLKKSLLYDESYSLVTQNKKILDELVSKGIATKVFSLNKEKFQLVAEKYPELLDFVDNEPTPYLKGL